MFSDIRIVLVCTSHPGNIGAAARAMKNMGLGSLYLVCPEDYPNAEATARASGADDVLAAARVCDSLDEALEGCGLVLGLSARRRTLAWPELDVREAARRAVGEAGSTRVAFVFGREKSGLSNEELERCHFLVHIPSNPDYSSLNVAAAVQVVSYEVRMVAGEGVEPVADAVTPAPAEELERYYAHLEQVLIETGFLDPAAPRQLMRRLRRLYGRARPDRNEINILRGILTAVQTWRGG